MRSPAEAYAAARTRAAHPELGSFVSSLSFELDDFQRRSCLALEEGHGVLVCAPTGAGKTVVGEFAVHLALARGQKCFYTTPIKALSNQKYADLAARHGADAVGLLTGDTAVNGSAPVVVMTTEVLRNMLYADAPALDGLAYVVMDEVHYLADRFRGAVWEEVILHLPEHVQLASLSATVSNAEEFGDWLVEVRGDTTVVVDETRPVPLWQHMVVGSRMFDLFAEEQKAGDSHKVTVDPTLAKAVAEVDRDGGGSRRGRSGPPPRRGRDGRRRDDRGSGPGRNGRSGSSYRPPSRVDVIERLDAAGLLPAITFIFSRAGCDAAVLQCVRSGLRLTDRDEIEQIRTVVDRRCAGLPDADLDVLGYWEWREGLERGVAAHHAGMLPAFKETVEELFVRGLVRAVFATETLALGINMPARTVVLEKLVKYNGESHVELTPGEYTQLTGRAGRRGIDVEGHAVVLWAPGMDPAQVAGLASTRTYPLRSSFRPGYNMAVNLVDRLGITEARELLEQSFAQFQADRSVVHLAKRVERNREALEGYAEAMGGGSTSDDAEGASAEAFAEYMDLRRRLSEREKQLAKQGRTQQKAEASASLEALGRGDVIAVPSGKRAGLAVVLDPGVDRSGRGMEPRPLVLTEDRWAGRLSIADFPDPVSPLGSMRLPKRVDHKEPRVRRDLANALRETGIEAPGRSRRRGGAGSEDPELASLRRAVRSHPCHGRADREDRARWAERHARLTRETEQLEQRVRSTTHSLARTFDRIRGLLTERGYLLGGAERDPDEELTPAGHRLSRLWGESDLLVAECLRHGVWLGLGPADLAAVASSLVYDSRRDDGGIPRVPDSVETAVGETVQIWTDLVHDERRHHLDRTREPDLGFAWPVYRWARGDALSSVLSSARSHGTELSAGDFVRWCRQVLDLLDQIRAVCGGEDPVGRAAANAGRAIRRGVVAVGES
ncbi:DEAD/DEAH box helicase [Actinomycetospora termitidis]|uniref:DEAD/DEAH box helicase n=1 Tax=Actinomycetospora termitidis TaxID=3053470 RepID=A0ABT7MBY8_9PSEU|nr:DEAD/DEAH box helicase [Actinomycetospora sp. Odt1-22]MDL5158180.1 DEAD/DEAH box helicase [Actinomycetospora sp. Odt1-22]